VAGRLFIVYRTIAAAAVVFAFAAFALHNSPASGRFAEPLLLLLMGTLFLIVGKVFGEQEVPEELPVAHAHRQHA
jgi:hypothetical protein